MAFRGPVSLKFYEFEIRVSFGGKNFAHSTWSKLLWCVTNVLLKIVIIQYLDLLIKLQEKKGPVISRWDTSVTQMVPNGNKRPASRCCVPVLQCNPMHGYCCKENKSTVIIETQFINISGNWYQYKHILAKHIMLAKWKNKLKKKAIITFSLRFPWARYGRINSLASDLSLPTIWSLPPT